MCQKKIKRDIMYTTVNHQTISILKHYYNNFSCFSSYWFMQTSAAAEYEATESPLKDHFPSSNGKSSGWSS